MAAAVGRVRRDHGWAGVPALGRAVVDQLALARAHADLVGALRTASAAARSCKSSRGAEAVDLALGAVWEALDRATGEAGAAPKPVTKAAAPPAAREPGGAAWDRRSRKARRRLADAERLVRHARKVGLLQAPEDPDCADGLADVPEGNSPAAGDPFAALAAPAPLEPLRGETAAFAEAMRVTVDAMRGAWPPPDRIRVEELRDPGCPWNPFAYLSEGDGEWAVFGGEHETPDEVAADLATWAPEHAALAAEYGVSRSAVSLDVRERTRTEPAQ